MIGQSESVRTELFCFDISKLSKVTQFLLSTIIVFVFFIINGYFLELLYKLDGMKDHSWYLTLIQFLFYVMFGVTGKMLTAGDTTRKGPMKIYFILALLTVATMGLSNITVAYLNYPTQVIFKCCKLIPVLIGGIIIQGKKYGGIDLLACLCMSIGLIMFTLADSKVQPNFNFYGVLFVSGALVADAIIGNVQEKTMKKHMVPNAEMILYSYSIGFLYILMGLLFSGQFFPAFSFFLQNPVETYGYGVIFSLSGYLGVNAVLSQVKIFGALTAVTVTTFRKMFSIILSFIMFSKPFTSSYIWSGLVVLFGVYLNLYSNNRTLIHSTFHKLMTYRLISSEKRALPLGIV